ncbi:hypothetical protein Tco_0875119 [Tanacetum coccineum]|uniref:Uncharacterized protein n=1 Tax=Tanacetum coccineum TaxID=301880 RepID=A0ABQ5BS48_9ASTR
MKEILHQRMFESGSYKTHSEHADHYEALDRSMARDNMGEFPAKKAKSRKRRRGDQDPPQPPPKESDQNLKDVGAAHLPKIKTLATWLRPLREEDRSKSLEPDWSVPLNNLPKPENNWANALAKSYKDLKENKLLRKTGNMGLVIKWFCKRIGEKKLSKSDLEGPAF